MRQKKKRDPKSKARGRQSPEDNMPQEHAVDNSAEKNHFP